VTQPRRRSPRRDNLDVETTLTRALRQAPEIELGWSLLRQSMRDAGWPARTPDGDRKPATGAHSDQSEASCIDYADTTGELALRLDHLAGDLDSLQDHWHMVASSLRAMALIARRHIIASAPAVPACDVGTCEQHVEYTASGGYRGMEQIAGMWVVKPGMRALCARHRSQERRAG
jgi:hypothetical protein